MQRERTACRSVLKGQQYIQALLLCPIRMYFQKGITGTALDNVDGVGRQGQRKEKQKDRIKWISPKPSSPLRERAKLPIPSKRIFLICFYLLMRYYLTYSSYKLLISLFDVTYHFKSPLRNSRIISSQSYFLRVRERYMTALVVCCH